MPLPDRPPKPLSAVLTGLNGISYSEVKAREPEKAGCEAHPITPPYTKSLSNGFEFEATWYYKGGKCATFWT
jgi:hypothetical protein